MYENAKYFAFNGVNVAINVFINGKQSSVSISEDNVDYQNIMALVAEGKLTIAPAEEQK